MNPILRIALTEILEHRRQRWMLVILAANYVLFGGVLIAAALALDSALSNPDTRQLLYTQLQAEGLGDGPGAIHKLLDLLTSSLMAALFTNLMLFVAIMTGYSVIHDRKHSTLPFLLLAPVSRLQLLLGKLLGALAIPFGLHLVSLVLICLPLRGLDTLQPFAARFGEGAAWWVAWGLTAPACAAALGALETVISALSNDVRTSMQFTSFFVGTTSLLVGYLLVDALPEGASFQLAVAAIAGVIAPIILAVGARLISRDVQPSLH